MKALFREMPDAPLQLVLDAANAVRRQLGKRPVRTLAKGWRGVNASCVLARTIGGAAVSYDKRNGTVHINAGGEDLPKIHERELAWFLYRFDRGYYPDLVGDKGRVRVP